MFSFQERSSVMNAWSAGWLVEWSAGWLVEWSAGWLVESSRAFVARERDEAVV